MRATCVSSPEHKTSRSRAPAINLLPARTRSPVIRRTGVREYSHLPRAANGLLEQGLVFNCEIPPIAMLPIAETPEHQCRRQKLAGSERHSDDAGIEQWETKLALARLMCGVAEGLQV